jgi:trigger factor
MQVNVENSEGLKRQLKVVIPASDLGQRFIARLDEVKDQVQIKGFRKGKVPLSHIKKVYGRSLMVEVLEKAVEETSRQAMVDRKERPALQPQIKLPEDQAEIEKVIDGKADLSYGMTFEVLPEILITELSALKVERLVAPIEASAIDEAVTTLAARNTSYEAETGRVAADGDRLTLDFLGKIDDVAFDGGKGEDVFLVLGQGGFIPGFEDGLKGSTAGDEKVITATFPEDYGAKELAGKTAKFETKVKEVSAAKKVEVNDEFAQSLGATDLAKLRELIEGQIQREHDQASRSKLKRALLDALDKAHDFTLPPTLVASEFESIWGQVTAEMKRAEQTFPHEGKTEDEARAEYQKIAERRVRLGLIIGEIGDKNKVQVSQDDLRRALMEQARRFPGQEKMIYEYYEKTPGAVAELRAPIFEDKVIDFIIEQANPTDKSVSKEELFKQDDTELA